MKMTTVLFVFFLGHVLIIFAESKTTANIPVGAIVKHINKQALVLKKKIINLARTRKSQINKYNMVGQMKIPKLMKMSEEELVTLTEKSIAAGNITLATAELMVNLVNETVAGLKESLQVATNGIKNLTLSYAFSVVGKYTTGMKKTASPAKVKGAAKNNLENKYKYSKIANTTKNRLIELFMVSAKAISDLTYSCVVMLLGTVDKQTKKLKPFQGIHATLTKTIEILSDKIHSSAEQHAGSYTDFVIDCLASLKGLVDTFKEFIETTKLELAKESDEQNSSQVIFDKINRILKNDYVKVMKDIETHSERILEDNSKTYMMLAKIIKH